MIAEGYNKESQKTRDQRLREGQKKGICIASWALAVAFAIIFLVVVTMIIVENYGKKTAADIPDEHQVAKIAPPTFKMINPYGATK